MSSSLKKHIKAAFAKPQERFINRELSWLAFNERVLEEAQNTKNPLLERVKFLSISASNLDEFFMVRVAGLQDQVKNTINEKSKDGRTPQEQLDAITEQTARLIEKQHACWQELQMALEKEKIHVVKPDALEKEDKAWLEEYFTTQVFQALTPIAVDPAHPFPFLPNLGLAMVLNLQRQSNVTSLKTRKKKKDKALPAHAQRAVILLPQKLDRFIYLPGPRNRKLSRMVLLEDVVALFLDKLFPGYTIKDSGMIRIIRDSELELSDEADDLLSTFESAVKRRRRGHVGQLRLSHTMPKDLREFVKEELQVAEENVTEVKGMLNLAGLMALYNLRRAELKYPPHDIRFPERINDFGGNCFDAIRAKDIVVHHPYESFDVVAQFVHQAAIDPEVVAIKQTLYRTSEDSPIVKALIEAAEAGKSVTVLVELKARFDEEANLQWGRNLERAGAQVIYGLAGLKTHAKVSLIVRKEYKGLRSYVHFGTGNYHPETAKVYTDLSFFTCDPALCRDAAHIFNYLTGYSPPAQFEKVAVAPLTLRKNLLELIGQEKEHALAGRPATIWAKMNSLLDSELIDALYDAAQAGVEIDLVVRGICCIRAGIPGFSENIRVKSVVGRFLEHSRVFCFGNGAPLPSPHAKLYISSADWMPRNLDGRVEVMVPIENPTVHEQIMGQILVANLKDKKQSWMMQADSSYARLPFTKDSFCAHDYFIHNPSLSGRGKALKHKANKPKPL